MNKERLGTFIGDCRRELGLTQRELAERLHVTDKAVSKWERGLSYPDVTLLEPLAAALGLGVEELMACRRQAVYDGEEDPMKNLLTISSDSLRRERRRSWGHVGAVLALVLAAALVIGYNALYVTETREDSFVLKETVDGADYLYMRQEGNLLKLRCGGDVDYDAITLEDQAGDPVVYRVELRWNRLTHTGTATSCTDTGRTVLGTMMTVTFEAQEAPLFDVPTAYYTTEDYYPDPYAQPAGQSYLCNFRVRAETEEPGVYKTLLLVKDCVNGTVADVDGDGENEAVIRTRWPEKPYTVYDMVDGEIVETWPDTVPEEVQEALVQIWEQ